MIYDYLCQNCEEIYTYTDRDLASTKEIFFMNFCDKPIMLGTYHVHCPICGMEMIETSEKAKDEFTEEDIQEIISDKEQ